MTYALREARPGTPGTLPARISPSRAVPDQFGRRWDGDDGSSPMPKAPNGLADLPPILPRWGPGRARPAASPADSSVIRYRDLIT